MARKIIYKGKEYKSLKALAHDIGGTSASISIYLRTGKNIDDFKSFMIVYKGRKYPSRAALCREVGANWYTVRSRLRKNMTLEEAIETPVLNKSPARDHLGNDYPSLAAMARAWNLRPNVLGHRLELGWTIERALTSNNGIEYAGDKFKNYRELCTFYDFPYPVFMQRIRKGWDVELALNTPVKHKNKMIQ